MSKYEKYQDYVIKDGRLVGEFDEMYKDFEDPWEQSTRETYAAEKAIAINSVKALGLKNILEFGCGFGYYSNNIKKSLPYTSNVVGIDISETAIKKAKTLHPDITFETGDILDVDLIRRHNPDVLILSEITWYILDKLDEFIDMIRTNFPNTYIIHLLNFYPAGQQKYGIDYFSNLDQLLDYFDMNYIEFGSITKPFHGRCSRSYFIGRYGKLDENYAL